MLGEGVFPKISLSCPRYRDPDGLYNSLKEKASSLFEETSPLAPPSLESQPLLQPATSETLLLMEDVEESGIPPAESHMDLPSSRPTQELEMEMDLIAVRESVAAGDGSRLVGSRHSGNCVRTYVRCCKPLGLCMYRHTYVHTCVYPTPCSQACLMCVCTPLPAHRPVLCVCVPHSLLTGLSCVCVYPTPCSQACLVCVPHSLLTGLSCVCTPLPAHRPVLPDYYLDFGYVVYGHVLRKTVFLTNVGDFPCTVAVGRRALAGTGFSVDLTDKIKALPEGERVECVVTFDPASVNCPTEETMAVLPLQVWRQCYTHTHTHTHTHNDGSYVCMLSLVTGACYR